MASVVLILVAVLAGGVAARAIARRTSPPGRATSLRAELLHGRVLRFLAGTALGTGVLLLVVRDAIAALGLASGTLPPEWRAGLVAAGGAGVVLAAVTLNALARPRGLTAGWVLVLAAPLIYLQAVVAMAWMAHLPPAPTWAVAAGIPAVGGAVTGAYLFLATLVGSQEDGPMGRASAAVLAVAAVLQGLAATVLVGGGPAGAGWVLAADVVTLAAAAFALTWGLAEDGRTRRERVVTLTPGEP